MNAEPRGAPARILSPIRSSFRAKLLAASLLSGAVVLGLALVVVQLETARQVAAATERISERSRDAFRQLEQLQQDELARLGRAFTESRRTLAVLEAAMESPDDREWLLEAVRYELDLMRMTRSVAAFTDGEGASLLVLVHGEAREAPDVDPHLIRRLAALVLGDGPPGGGAYGVVDDELFIFQVQRLGMDGDPMGTVVLGAPIDDEVAHRLGDALDVEICFMVDGRCLAGTAAARSELSGVIARASPDAGPRMVTVAGGRWEVLSEPLAADRPEEGWRTVALSVDEILAPFDRISRALLLAGILALALAVFLGLLLARGLARPVRDLVEATGRVAGGDFGARVEVRSEDEVGRLADAFNRMTEGLELKERYRGVLDKVVSREVADELLRSGLVLGGETREVTTLFADINGFTELTQGMEPQEVIRLLNDCMARLSEEVDTGGAVVDKYLGDGLMALFGAPVSRPDDAARAVRTGLRMQERMGELNRERSARGEAPIRIALGIARGSVVAGNMGSPSRLNYTAVGESVNLAARLCEMAAPGGILVSEAVQRAAGGAGRFRGLGPRALKGFARAVEVFAVEGGEPTGPADGAHAEAAAGAGRRGRTSPGGSALLLAGLLAAAAPGPSPAQEGGVLPTLSDLGVHYLSPSGRFEVGVAGRLDLEGYVPQDEPQWLIPSTDPFLAGRLRLFTDLFLGDALYGLVELRADRGEAPADGSLHGRVQQALVRVALPGPGQLHVQAGKFALPIGSYPRRYQGPGDPFVRPPVHHDHRTIAAPSVTPAAAAGFLGWKDEEGRRERGMPVLWGVPYPWGAMLAGAARGLDFRLALMGSAPSAGPGTWKADPDRFRSPTLLAAVSHPLGSELRVGAFYGRGPWLEELDPALRPPGSELEDFHQELVGGEAAFALGHVSLRAEVVANRWEVPNVGDGVRDLSYSVEGSAKLTTRLSAAARFGEIRFNELTPAPGAASVPWDHDVRRLQLAAGYRLQRNSGLKAEYLLSRTAGQDPRDDLFSLQWWWDF